MKYYTLLYYGEIAKFGIGVNGEYRINNGRYPEEFLAIEREDAEKFLELPEFGKRRHVMKIVPCEAWFDDVDNRWDIYLW